MLKKNYSHISALVRPEFVHCENGKFIDDFRERLRHLIIGDFHNFYLIIFGILSLFLRKWFGNCIDAGKRRKRCHFSSESLTSNFTIFLIIGKLRYFTIIHLVRWKSAKYRSFVFYLYFGNPKNFQNFLYTKILQFA